MANDTAIGHLKDDLLDSVMTWLSLGFGLPGNVMIILAFWSYPPGPAKLLYRLLAVFDTISLVLLVSQRPLAWSDLLNVESRATSIILKAYLNTIYYTSIFTNNISVFVILERLLYSRSPNAHVQYFQNLDRVKLTLLILGLLMVSFCLIITIKMSYYGLAWIVVFLFFYTVWPSLSIIACIFLLISHNIKKYNEKKFLEQNKPLTGSRLSFGDKSYSHHSALSASGPLKGSSTSAHGFKGKKRDPYSLYLVDKSASESHLAVKQEFSKSKSSSLSKSKSGNCVDTVVSLKVPSLYSLAQHKTMDKEDFLTQEQEEQLLRKKMRNRQLTLMAVFGSVFVVLSIVPLSACASLLMKNDEEGFDLADRYTYLMITVTHFTMYVINASKFYMYCLVSSIFRRHVLAVFTCSQRSLALEEAPSTAQ